MGGRRGQAEILEAGKGQGPHRVDEGFKLGLTPANPPSQGRVSSGAQGCWPTVAAPPKAIIGAARLPLKGKAMHKPPQSLLWSETKHGQGPLNWSLSNG